MTKPQSQSPHIWPGEVEGSISMRRLRGGGVEVRRFDQVAARLAGENGEHVMDMWALKPPSARGHYAEGVLHGLALSEAGVRDQGSGVRDQGSGIAAAATKPARRELVFLRDPATPAARARGELELVFACDGRELVHVLTPERAAAWMRALGDAVARRLEGGGA
jgi:hypothetical protein